MNVESRTKASIGATIIFAVVAAVTMVANASPANATPTHFVLGVVQIGDPAMGGIVVEYEGNPVLLVLETSTTGWVITGGKEPIPTADIWFHVDLVTLTHISLLLVEVLLYNTGDCLVTFHGLLLLDVIAAGQYHGHFEKDDLNGILYSAECGMFLEGLILTTIANGDVLVLFHLA